MSTLFIVGTPIGNLSDLTLRAIETLKSVDAVLCEDTRVTVKLLSHLGIKKPLISFHQYSDVKRMNEIFALLKEGKNLALVTDAGTPGISDPGSWLVHEVVQTFGSDVTVVPIPGASAVVTALSISGFTADEFVFLGFPPHKKGRKTFFDNVATESRTIVLYESTHRITKALDELATRVANRPIVVCRELTKLYESIYRGTAAEVTEQLKKSSLKGEFVVVVGPG